MALGFGFRCGFLGLLHLEIIQERLERECNLDLVTTAPSVVYKVYKTDGTSFDLTNPTNLPDPSEIEHMEEPIVSAEIMVAKDYVGPIMDLCQTRRGRYLSMEYIEQSRALLKYELPLNEIIYDFFDALKSRSKGYASFDYELKGYEQSSLVKLDILVNREEVDALSFIVHSDSAYERGRKMCEKESIEALPYDFPAGITFAEYKGDIEKLIKAVAEVEDGWVKYFEEGGRVFCAFDGDEIAAFCFITDMGMHDGVHVGGPGCVGTVPKYRKRGIGLEMVRRATHVLAAEGYDISWIHYTHLAHWYEKIGYHTVLKWNRGGFIKEY